ncbi:MAG: methionine synthase [Candidatus Omnitrophica bacterium]|jgi:methionine synthase II (cobalamin-independent)|nr:methionine synthase [Candidatus Omnitrophota bacterium]MDD5077695.1 methionine synthase [Candidatus Omnitrophota bacterium]MDD5724751.1 methionine synthase [Candidatus Omnitrophota bacterium]
MNLKGMALGIGSLPLKDAREAVDLVLRYLPQAPFWPQLPKRDTREGMLAQFNEGLPGIKFNGPDLKFDPQDKEKELEIFYERFIAGDLQYFKISRQFAEGLYEFKERLGKGAAAGAEFIKCQVTGPFTFCAGINDSLDRPIIHDEIVMQAVSKGLAMKALWQLEFFKDFGKKMIVFFDEPYLAGVGSAYNPLDRSAVIGLYEELAAVMKERGCLVGIHCCGNTDWSMLTGTPGIDIINFDAFNFLERFVLYADDLNAFLGRGGIICWGIVPTQEFNSSQSAEMLADKINSGLDALEKKGVDRRLLLEGLLISPACGLGTLDALKAEGILGLLDQTSQFIRKNF